ncbi:hypothetical protein PFISCL1PPCAC_23177, partial [Pristionchus fissidentatus]
FGCKGEIIDMELSTRVVKAIVHNRAFGLGMITTSTISFFVNGNEVTVENPDPELTLATFLRYKLNLTGTKLACEEGACGACTVAIARWNKKEKKAKFFQSTKYYRRA